MQGTQVWNLVWEDSTCHRAANSMLHNKRSQNKEKPTHRNYRVAPTFPTRESQCSAMKTQHSQKLINKRKEKKRITIWSSSSTQGIYPKKMKTPTWKDLCSFSYTVGLPSGLGGKESDCQCKRHKVCGFDPWVEKIPWRSSLNLDSTHSLFNLVHFMKWLR